jgi:hypothetical protein
MRRRQANVNSIMNRADGRWGLVTHLAGVDLRVCRWLATSSIPVMKWAASTVVMDIANLDGAVDCSRMRKDFA